MAVSVFDLFQIGIGPGIRCRAAVAGRHPQPLRSALPGLHEIAFEEALT